VYVSRKDHAAAKITRQGQGVSGALIIKTTVWGAAMSLKEIISLITSSASRRKKSEKHFRRLYLEVHGRELDTKHPVLFSEKLFHRMIDISKTGNKTYSRLADKYNVRNYVSEVAGENYLVPLHWHGTDLQAIPFDQLPGRYVIKPNHGSGTVIRVEGNPNRQEIIDTLSKWLSSNYYQTDHEYHYASIKPMILIEDFLDDGAPLGPLNYSFWSFHGQPAVIQVDNRNRSINPFYDTNWNKLTLTSRRNLPDCDVAKPANLDEMVAVAQKLSKGFDFVRVDLYNVKGQIYFGELTFTPGAGRFRFLPEEWDHELGKRWRKR